MYTLDNLQEIYSIMPANLIGLKYDRIKMVSNSIRNLYYIDYREHMEILCM